MRGRASLRGEADADGGGGQQSGASETGQRDFGLLSFQTEQL